MRGNGLTRGDPVPWFTQRSFANPYYAFSSAAGRYIVLGFFGTAGDSAPQRALSVIGTWRDIFDDTFASFFGISIDLDDERQRRVKDMPIPIGPAPKPKPMRDQRDELDGGQPHRRQPTR